MSEDTKTTEKPEAKQAEAKQAKAKQAKTKSATTQKKEGTAKAAKSKAKARSANGLVSGIDYPYTESGFIDWKAMLDDEQIVLNREKFQQKGIELDELSSEEFAEIKAKASEKEKLVLLQGFKDVARLRGVKSLSTEIVTSSETHVAIKYTIDFIPNSENPHGLQVSAIANASTANTQGAFNNFLEAIAENRAFVRAVKNALNISLLGQDELPADEEKVIVTKDESSSVVKAVKDFMKKHGFDFATVKKAAVSKGEFKGAEEWESVDDIPSVQALLLLKRMKEKAGES